MSAGNKISVSAIIPAKMTSQRFPRKNIAELCGRPLLYYSIRVAQLCEMIDRVYVSSESDEILALADAEGAIPLTRDKKLSEPHVTNEMVLKASMKSIQELESDPPEILVLLQPTHPLRQPKDLDLAIHTFIQNTHADSLFSLIKTDELRGEIVNDLYVPEYSVPRDKRKEKAMYINAGSFYILRTARTLMKNSMFGENIHPFVLEQPEFEVDIDYPSDMKLASCLLESNPEVFRHFDVKR